MERGLPLRMLKIVAWSDQAAARAAEVFRRVRGASLSPKAPVPVAEARGYDVFLSYAHKDEAPAKRIVEKLEAECPGLAIFFDRTSLETGGSWLLQLSESLDHARRVVALYTRAYWESKVCQLEIAAAMARQIDAGAPVLFPIYYSEANIPYFFRQVQYEDCRETDDGLLDLACVKLTQRL